MFEKFKNKIQDLYKFFRDKMWGDKEKRDKYYPVAYELCSKNILDNDQMQTTNDTIIRSAKWIIIKKRMITKFGNHPFFNFILLQLVLFFLLYLNIRHYVYNSLEFY